MASTPPPYITNPHYYHSVTQQQTMPVPTAPILLPALPSDVSTPSRVSTRKQALKRILAIVTVLALFIIMYFTWNPPTPSPPASSSTITQQNFGSGSTATTHSTATTTGGDIQVYIVGAVKHPGVYTLPPGARVYALLQAAGGPLSRANLVALNLAAALADGEEVYVTAIGEAPPTYMGGVPGPPNSTTGTSTTGSPTTGQLVNINSASVDEIRQSLHVSSTTAQNIVNYRLQHGPYTSVDQLLQVVSSTYSLYLSSVGAGTTGYLRGAAGKYQRVYITHFNTVHTTL